MKHACCLFLLPVLALSALAAPALEEQALWTSGQDGYHTYRIPALLVTAKGSVLAFCEGRKTGPRDHGDIDLLLKRSTDGGRTWSARRIVHEEGGTAEITIGNPCAVLDARTGVVWLSFCRDNREVFVTASEDDGLTWSAPRNVSDTAVKPNWNWVATGPGIGIQLERGPHRGRLVIPCDHRIDRGGKRAPDSEWNSHMMYSDDGGRSWQTGGPIQAGGNECQVIERADGSLLVNTRMQGDFQGWRGIATSTDGGLTWTRIAQEKQLPCPLCQASLIRLRSGHLLFSNPDPQGADLGQKQGGRINLTLRLGEDEGDTWPVAKRLRTALCGYSSLAELPDGTFLCLYETGTGNYRETLTLARFNLDWLTAP